MQRTESLQLVATGGQRHYAMFTYRSRLANLALVKRCEMSRHFVGALCASVIFTLACSMMIFLIKPILIDELVLKFGGGEAFKGAYLWLLIYNGAALFYIVYRHSAISGRYLYIPIFWIIFTYSLCLLVPSIIGREAYLYGILPFYDMLSKADLTSRSGWEKVFIIFFVVPAIVFYGYLRRKARPQINNSAPLTFAQIGSFIFGVGLAAYQYSQSDKPMSGVSAASDPDPTAGEGSEDYDVPDLFS
jgi:hypothetical protein